MHPNELTINDYVDDALGSVERADVERHLTTCGACRQLADDLRDVRRRAGALALMTPPERVWKRIDRELRPADRATEASRSVSQPSPRASRYIGWKSVAVAAVLVLCALVGMRYELRKRGDAPSTVAARSEAAQSVESELLQAEQHYVKAISGLEQITKAEKGAIDPQTAAVLQKNFSVIDQAISESRAALKAQPNSEPAQQSLLESFKTKIAMLQDTVALINEMRKGNDVGAARIVSGLKHKS